MPTVSPARCVLKRKTAGVAGQMATAKHNFQPTLSTHNLLCTRVSICMNHSLNTITHTFTISSIVIITKHPKNGI